jgi:uncharacterized LabA/DUF88 family protein
MQDNSTQQIRFIRTRDVLLLGRRLPCSTLIHKGHNIVYNYLTTPPMTVAFSVYALGATDRLMAVLSFLKEAKLKTIVFVDGYNLYYGLLRRSSYKWLDLYTLFQNQVLQNAEVLEIRYYTAPVLARMSDDTESPKRQRTYLQALRKHHPQKVTIIEGKMIAATPFSRLVEPLTNAPDVTKVQVYSFEEKQSDVNMAVDMVISALTNACEQIVLCSNDSDLKTAVMRIKQYAPHIRLGLVVPIKSTDSRAISKDLNQYADWSKVLSTLHLSKAQLPEKIHSTAIKKPDTW